MFLYFIFNIKILTIAVCDTSDWQYWPRKVINNKGGAV